MTIQQLLAMMSNKLAALNNAQATADRLGNLEEATRLSVEIQETQTTINQLQNVNG